jgi:hypothetical protein
MRGHAMNNRSTLVLERRVRAISSKLAEQGSSFIRTPTIWHNAHYLYAQRNCILPFPFHIRPLFRQPGSSYCHDSNRTINLQRLLPISAATRSTPNRPTRRGTRSSIDVVSLEAGLRCGAVPPGCAACVKTARLRTSVVNVACRVGDVWSGGATRLGR